MRITIDTDSYGVLAAVAAALEATTDPTATTFNVRPGGGADPAAWSDWTDPPVSTLTAEEEKRAEAALIDGLLRERATTTGGIDTPSTAGSASPEKVKPVGTYPLDPPCLTDVLPDLALPDKPPTPPGQNAECVECDHVASGPTSLLTHLAEGHTTSVLASYAQGGHEGVATDFFLSRSNAIKAVSRAEKEQQT